MENGDVILITLSWYETETLGVLDYPVLQYPYIVTKGSESRLGKRYHNRIQDLCQRLSDMMVIGLDKIKKAQRPPQYDQVLAEQGRLMGRKGYWLCRSFGRCVMRVYESILGRLLLSSCEAGKMG
jgi:hypothetical protein